MSYYAVTVDKDKYKVEASFPADASRKGRDEWRNSHRLTDKDDAYKEPEPRTVVVVLIGTGIPIT